jgi:hypothetical protein
MRGDRALAWVVCGGAVLLLASPLKLLWAHPDAGWAAPFLIWLALIAAAAWLAHARGSGNDDL